MDKIQHQREIPRNSNSNTTHFAVTPCEALSASRTAINSSYALINNMHVHTEMRLNTGRGCLLVWIVCRREIFSFKCLQFPWCSEIVTQSSHNTVLAFLQETLTNLFLPSFLRSLTEHATQFLEYVTDGWEELPKEVPME